MRLNRYLALCGLGSRRECESLIIRGAVEINGSPVTELATTVRPGDRVTVDGKPVSAAQTRTLILYKPVGYHCTRRDPKGRPVIYDLLPPQYRNLHYCGRLDAESEGLIVLTNDGDLTQRLTHPKHEVEKEYLVGVDHPVRREQIGELLAGIPLEEGLAKAAVVRTISPRRFSVVLQQGMNRQVRRMFAALGRNVERLIRIRIGMLTVDDLKPGRWRLLRPDETEKLTAPWQRRPRPAPAGRKSREGGTTRQRKSD